MRYVIPNNALDKLALLRQQYQKEKNINLDEKPSIIGMPTMFGGTDVEARRNQIVFMEKMITILRPNLKKLEEITTPEELQAAITAWRVYLTASWHIQSQNSSSSKLNVLLNHDLGITAENYPDEEDKESCYATASRFVNTKGALEEANVALIKARQRPFTEQEWNEFSEFIPKLTVKQASTNSFANYPISSVTQPLFRATFSYTGATIGLLGGDVISKSTKAMSVKYQLTALIGGILLTIGPTGPTGVALFAPVIVSKLVTAFCSITLAHVLGTAMGALGDGVGMIVGFPFDLAYQLLWKICTLIGSYYHTEPKQPMITGMRISDGATIICGIPVTITPEEELAKYDKIIELKEDGSLYVDGKPIVTPENGIQLSAESIEKLREHLKLYIKEQEQLQSKVKVDSADTAVQPDGQALEPETITYSM